MTDCLFQATDRTIGWCGSTLVPDGLIELAWGFVEPPVGTTERFQRDNVRVSPAGILYPNELRLNPFIFTESSHAVDSVLAAFAMVDVVTRREGKLWPIRIGVHTGPVVSGVVGVRKFAFDVWGESVNFASRIESSGSPNRINLSASTYSRVKDFFSCEHRGKVAIKEGREFDMYFASGLNEGITDTDAFSKRYQLYFKCLAPALPSGLGLMKADRTRL